MILDKQKHHMDTGFNLERQQLVPKIKNRDSSFSTVYKNNNINVSFVMTQTIKTFKDHTKCQVQKLKNVINLS